MLKERARAIAAAVFAADLAIVAVAFLAAHALRQHWLTALGLVARPIYDIAAYLPLLPVALIIWGLFLLSSDTYRSHRTTTLPQEGIDLLRLSALAALTFVIVLFFLRIDELVLGDDRVSRAWVALFAALSFLGILIEKISLRVVARWARRRGYNYRTILLVGAGPIARAIAESIEAHRYWGFRLIGLLSPPNDDPPLQTTERLGSFSDLGPLIEAEPVDEVILTVDHLDHPELEEGLLRAQELGLNVRFAFDPLPTLAGNLQLGELDGIPLVTWTRIAASPTQLMVKRLIDIATAAAVLIVLGPFMAMIAAAIKATSEGPILFHQQRVGLNGRVFTLLKFRTMVNQAESRQRDLEHHNEMSGPVFKIKHDPRVTRVGKLIRRFSLDELPQLWNVLKGDMSLVGPRPPIPAEVAQYDRWQKRRLSMRPGLTCLWQIGGRNEVDFDRWMELDLAYIDNWSPWLDIKIIARTVPAVISGRGAY